ncbi:bifunctional UDP-N-acetylglucosamine diphosphorylase/glucosamine-1-phosphate N-acetyltransferase GlmU [Paracidobacterium acidisoli]|uniref:Bifunctional protein GlmU n=1 Tax=Paracidobacterium acidisoli TaxID=2303751 RepID=A0A372IP79_9BACT|nr:bifunctional UDP-N-acetylglucosamine diphosphorylase/glucosamine-1-phosphate N-acetyltransferase GlmU [Paracidobacterium acidisoli]MBT9330978.1 bifunctional UDP-N-acetylglucosamine diphosphorylase/glucosamine-1-phosphate N-acetyltransferase GlmU [Paracidobacterium acidisoli]
MRLGILIMAAGKGTRLKSKRAKVLHEIGGRPLLSHVIAAAAQIVTPQDIHVVVGHQAAQVEAAVSNTHVQFVQQTEQRGTGHAIQCAEAATRDYEHLLVLSGDVPLLRPETIARLRDFHLSERAAMTILTAAPADPTGYGRVVRRSPKSPEVSVIVEQKALTPAQQQEPEINSGIYAFRRDTLYQHIGSLHDDNAHHELYLTDMAGILSAAGERVVAIEASDPIEVLGANTIAEMMDLDREMRLTAARRLMSQGVTIFRPDTVIIDVNVEVGPDTIIEPFVQLLGETKVGSDCRIRSGSVLESATLGDGIIVRNSCVISESKIEKGARIGPFAHIRPGSHIGESAHVGNFVETKKARLGTGAKANHLAYLGDAEIGNGTNIGAGTITCNYDGVHKHPTIIQDGVFIGSNSTLVAPLVIGEGAYVAAGSCITENVPADALALGRSRQTTKPHWAKNRRGRDKGQS